MPEFAYRARTPDGQEVTGRLTAGDETWARRSLEGEALDVLEIHVVGQPPAADPKVASEPLLAQAVPAVAARLPLEDTLDVIAAEAEDRHLGDAAAQLANELRRGASVEDAIRTIEARVSPEVRGLLAAGIRCGNPAAVVESFARSRQQSLSVARTVRSVLAYPLLVLAILLPLTAFFAVVVIPIFAEIYAEFDMSLPQLSIAVIEVARDAPLILGVVVLVPLAIVVTLRLFGLTSLWHRFRGALPLFGRLWTWSAQRELAAVLASLTAQRVPLAEGVAFAAGMLTDRNLARACRQASRQAEQGATLSDAMAGSIHFDRLLTALVRWGEQHNELPAALEHASAYFTEQIEHQAAGIRRLLPPLTAVLVGVILILGVIGLFVPLVKLVEGLS